MRPGIRVAALATLLTILNGCSTEETEGSASSGEGINDGIGVGDTIAGGGTSGTGISLGSISSFGSVVVNGIKFDVSEAAITVNGQEVRESDLHVGLLVRIEGDLQNADAKRVDFVDTVRGPIDNLVVSDSGNLSATLTILGQTVQTNSLTHFIDTQLDPADPDTLETGDGIVAVSGFRNAAGHVIASAIRPQPEDSALAVSGKVTRVVAHTFMLGQLRVDFSAADLSSLPGGVPVEGQLVSVQGLSRDFESQPPSIQASVVEPALRLEASPGDIIEIEALVLEASSAPSTFQISDFAVATTQATEFDGGSPADIQTDRMVEVEGFIDQNGVLQANRVVIKPISYPIRIRAPVQAINLSANSFSMLNINVQINALTRFIDASNTRSDGFGFNDIAVGEVISMRGSTDSTGIVASVILREDADNRVLLQGLVEAEDEAAGTVTKSGITVSGVEPGTRFQDVTDRSLSQSEFHAAVDIGSIVRSVWDPFTSIEAMAGELKIVEEFQPPKQLPDDGVEEPVGNPSTITVAADQDSLIRQAAPGDNSGGEKELSVKNKPGDSERSIYRFNLATLPDGVRINSATLRLRTTTPDSAPINIYRITDNWSEGSVTWDSTGSDFDSAVIHGSFTPTTDDAFVSVDITSLVQQWACGATNHGLMLLATSNDVQSKYHSKEEDQPGFQPSLQITFTSGAGSCP